jgi:hypothetical protein
MKFKALLITVLLALCVTHLVAGEPKGRILRYGIFKRAEKEQVIRTPETPSGVTRIPAGYPMITTITNRVPARKGVQFGISYEVTNLDLKDGEVAKITKITTHPQMKKPDGKIWESFAFVEEAPVKKGRVEAQTGYGFDHDYELVTGVWRMEMKCNGKTLMTQEFIVFQE